MYNLVSDEVWNSLSSHARSAIRGIVYNDTRPFILMYRDEDHNTQMVADRLTGADALHISFSLFALLSATFGNAMIAPVLASLILGYSSMQEIEAAMEKLANDSSKDSKTTRD
jgi:hypothetical protein